MKKSDVVTEGRVSATEASRSFSRLLDRVEHGRRFRIHRHGKDVCVIGPPPVEGRRISECLALLRGRAPVLLDDRFARDLSEILAGEVVDAPLPWDS